MNIRVIVQIPTDQNMSSFPMLGSEGTKYKLSATDL